MSDQGPTEHRADDWETLQGLLHRDSWNPDLGRHRSPYVFRGVSSAAYSLETSLQRFVGDSGDWALEGHLLRSFMRYAREDVAQLESPYHLMALAQHHGLPTRLLDWTHSPAIGAYFATGGSPDADGVVWAVDFARVHEHVPPFLRELLDRLDTDVFDADLMYDATLYLLEHYRGADETPPETRTVQLYDMRDAIQEFTESYPDDYVMFFEPPSIDERIINQAALFSTTSDPRLPLDEWLERHPELSVKIVVPGARKAEFRDKLDQQNVNHRTLFPGLDGIATWLKDFYAPRHA